MKMTGDFEQLEDLKCACIGGNDARPYCKGAKYICLMLIEL